MGQTHTTKANSSVNEDKINLKFQEFSLKMKLSQREKERLLKSLVNQEIPLKVDKILPNMESLKEINSLRFVLRKTSQMTEISKLIQNLSLNESNSLYLKLNSAKSDGSIWKYFIQRFFFNFVKSTNHVLLKSSPYDNLSFKSAELDKFLEIVAGKFPFLKEIYIDDPRIVGNFYSLNWEFVWKILSLCGKTLEKIMFSLGNNHENLLTTIEKISVFNKLQLIRISFAYADNPYSSLCQLQTIFHRIFERNNFGSLKDFGIMLSISEKAFLEVPIVGLMNFINKVLPQLISLKIIIKTLLSPDNHQVTQSILENIFKTKSLTLQEVTIGIRHQFPENSLQKDSILEELGCLLQESSLILLKFHFYYSLDHPSSREEVKKLLIILIEKQPFVLDFGINIIYSGKKLIQTYGFSKCLEKYCATKKSMILAATVCNPKLRKIFRKEIRNEILEAFI